MRNRSDRLRVWLLAGACAVSAVGAASAQNQAPIPGASQGGIAGQADAPPKEAPAPLSARFGVPLPGVIATEQMELLNLGAYAGQLDGPDGGPLYEGIQRAMPQFDLGMGEWHTVPADHGGGWLWVMDIKSPGAFAVRPHFSDFRLPAGAMAMVYDPLIPQNLPGVYTGQGPLDTGEFWAWTCWHETARIEVYFPPEAGDLRFGTTFTIDTIAHTYRNPATGAIGYFNDRELGCHNDVSCFTNWLTNAAGVGRMSWPTSPGFVGLCSGSMINNNSGDLTPYFLTARHCMQDVTTNLQNLEVYWFYQTPSCNGAVPSLGSVPRSTRSSYVFTSNSSDMSLVMIEGTVPRNLWWSGWNTGTFGNGTAVTGIHHPDGSFKRISFGTTSSNNTSCGATGMTDGYVVNWGSGATEPGSSGSPLYTSNGQVIGVDSCGINAQGCSSPAWYGRFGGSGPTFANIFSTGAYDDSNENNDSCGSATNLNVYTNGTLYSQIVKINHDDWFHISVPAFGSVSFHTQFTHAEGDIDMQMHDGCGGVLASSTGTVNGETINWTNPGATAREVYLHVYLYNDTRNIYYLDFARYGAVAPVNDTCANAATIPAGGQGSNASGTTQGGSVDGSSSCASTGVAPDVWFRVSVPCTRVVSLSTEFSAFDTVLSVHTGCPGTTANQVACNDDVSPGTLWSSLSFTANGGTTYYVRLSGYNGAFGNYNFDSNTSNASNDLCADTLDVGEGTYNFDNCPCDTDGPPDDTCLAFGSNQIYKDFWMAYTAPCSGTLDVNTLGSGFDTRIAVYANPDNSSCPPGPNSAIACNDDVNAAYESRVLVDAAPGQRYVIRVGSYASTVGHSGLLTIAFTPAAPVSDDCANANDITPGSYAWLTCGYATEGPTETCIGSDGQVYNDRWFAFTPDCDGTIDFNTVGAGVDTRIALYNSCPTGDNQTIACNDDISPGADQESQLIAGVSAGTRYLLRIGNWAPEASAGLSFNLAFTPDGGCTACDTIDFNNDGLFPDTSDIDDFLSVFSGGPCSNDPNCGDIDFNNDGLFPDTTDIDSLLSVFSGGPCI
ncbi:MAG: trypsin-like peptidase domain-containing protein [Phycisphaerales bacterium]